MTRAQEARAARIGVLCAADLSVERANALRLEGYRTANVELESAAVQALNWIRAGRNPVDSRRFIAQKLCQNFFQKSAFEG